MRLSSDERRILERRAEIAGVPVAEFIRELIVKKEDDEDLARLKKVLAAWTDITQPEENMRGALLAQLADTAANLLAFRGYFSLKELDMMTNIALKMRGLPGAYVKVSEESKSMNAHVHTTAPTPKTWEQRIAEANSADGTVGAGDRGAVTGSGDPSIIDVESHPVTGELVPGPVSVAAVEATSRNGRGSRRAREAGVVPDSTRDGKVQ